MKRSTPSRLSRARPCWSETPLSIEEVLTDPIISAVMKADRVSREELALLLGNIRKILIRNAKDRIL